MGDGLDRSVPEVEEDICAVSASRTLAGLLAKSNGYGTGLIVYTLRQQTPVGQPSVSRFAMAQSQPARGASQST
jgi:hypothetical protein